MIFSKNSISKNTSNSLNINILGNSALGLSIAKDLKKNGHHIKIICSPVFADELNATDIVYKDSRVLQNHRSNFFFTYEQIDSPDLLIIASEIHNLRQDLLLLSPSKLQNTTILNLYPHHPETLIKEIIGISPVECRIFDTMWLHKNTIYGSEQEFSVLLNPNTNSEQLDFLQSAFANTNFKFELSEDFYAHHWKWLCLKVIVLLGFSSKQSLHTLCKTTQGREQIDNCIKEILYLAKSKNQNFSNNSILNILHNFNDEQIKNMAHQRIFIERLFNILFNGFSPDKKRFPVLKSIFDQLINKT